MNRLILIGNGFDLAHGMKTSYNDFMLWYLKRCYKRALSTGTHQDGLLSIKRGTMFNKVAESFIEDNLNVLYDNSQLHLLISSRGFLTLQHNPTPSELFTTQSSGLLAQLLRNCSNANWVDIENEFYKELTRILRKKDSQNELKGLNDALGELIKYLHTYLTELNSPPYIKEYEAILTTPIVATDFPDKRVYKYKIKLEDIMILNFNYTNTVERYLKNFEVADIQEPPILNCIHGSLIDESNPIIFGFGDELDSAYKEMEQQPLNGFFDYTKSFWYFKTLNYRKLLNFVQSSDYQVFILGQSCGLSDRTMLSMLFKHSNCKSVKIFYHGDKDRNNYTDITHQLGRQFSDKDSMRNVIVPLPLCDRMPQHDDEGQPIHLF